MKVTDLEAVLAERERQIQTLTALHDFEKRISQNWREAAEARLAALKTDDKLLESYNLERSRLISERDSARRGGTLKLVVGAALGLVLGAAITK